MVVPSGGAGEKWFAPIQMCEQLFVLGAVALRTRVRHVVVCGVPSLSVRDVAFAVSRRPPFCCRCRRWARDSCWLNQMSFASRCGSGATW